MVLAPEAENAVALQRGLAASIDEQVESLVGGGPLEPGSEAYRALLAEVETLGGPDLRATALLCGRLLARTGTAMAGLGEGEEGIGRRLEDLRRWAEALRLPAREDGPPGGGRRLGLFPRQDPLEELAARLERGRERVEATVAGLYDLERRLRVDGAAIAQEQTAIWTQVEALRGYAYMAQRLEASVAGRLGAGADDSPDELLYAARRRRQDILTQLAIALQGFAALRVLVENNDELLRAIDVATTTTMAALRTAEVAAQAMAARRRLDEALAGAAEPGLEPAAEATALREASGALVRVLDEIESYRAAALGSITATAAGLEARLEGRAPGRQSRQS